MNTDLPFSGDQFWDMQWLVFRRIIDYQADFILVGILTLFRTSAFSYVTDGIVSSHELGGKVGLTMGVVRWEKGLPQKPKKFCRK